MGSGDAGGLQKGQATPPFVKDGTQRLASPSRHRRSACSSVSTRHPGIFIETSSSREPRSSWDGATAWEEGGTLLTAHGTGAPGH